MAMTTNHAFSRIATASKPARRRAATATTDALHVLHLLSLRATGHSYRATFGAPSYTAADIAAIRTNPAIPRIKRHDLGM